MTPKWQQSEEAEAAGRSLSEGRIMSVQGPELFLPLFQALYSSI